MGNPRSHIRSGDMVEVTVGNHKKSRGRVIQVNQTKQQVIVEGVRMISKHLPRSRQNPDGGIVQCEGPLHISNVRLIHRQSTDRDVQKE